MSSLAWRLAALLTLTLLSACQRQNTVELTLVARGIQLETQIAALRETATVGAERLQVTVEYMATRAEVALRQRQGMDATLVARGSPAPGNFLPTGTPFPLPGAAQLSAPTAPGASPTPLPPGQAAFSDVVMAASVRDNDCPDERRSDFSTTAQRIYIVAMAHSIPARANLAARFVVGGREVLHEWRPDSSVDGNCIWFYIDQGDLPFVAGTWSARLELEEQPASPALTFRILDAQN